MAALHIIKSNQTYIGLNSEGLLHKHEPHGGMGGSVVIRAKDSCTDNYLGDTVRITVGRRTPILQISTAILTDLAWNADRRSAVRDSSGEVMNAAGLMTTSQSTFVVTTTAWIVRTDVTVVFLAHLLNRFIYRSNNNDDDKLITVRVDASDNSHETVNINKLNLSRVNAVITSPLRMLCGSRMFKIWGLSCFGQRWRWRFAFRECFLIIGLLCEC